LREGAGKGREQPLDHPVGITSLSFIEPDNYRMQRLPSEPTRQHGPLYPLNSQRARNSRRVESVARAFEEEWALYQAERTRCS